MIRWLQTHEMTDTWREAIVVYWCISQNLSARTDEHYDKSLRTSENKCDPGTSRIGSRGCQPWIKIFRKYQYHHIIRSKMGIPLRRCPFRIWDDNCISTQRTEARPPKDHSRIRKLYKHHTKCQFAVPYSRFNSQELYEIQTMDRLTTYLEQKYIIKQHTSTHT